MDDESYFFNAKFWHNKRSMAVCGLHVCGLSATSFVLAFCASQ